MSDSRNMQAGPEAIETPVQASDLRDSGESPQADSPSRRAAAGENASSEEGRSARAELAVSVVVPVRCGREGLRQCLEAVAAATGAHDEVLVVYDGEMDGWAETARQLGFVVLNQERTSGPARARNLGARRARGAILLFVDADVVLPPGAIGQIRQTFKADAGLTALFGSFDDRPAAPNFLSQYKNLLNHYVHQHSRQEACTFWGSCGAIRREAFLAMGGFDESYRRPGVEDIELGYRLAEKGHRIRLCPWLQVKHLKVWRAGSLLWTDFFLRALPWTELILRHGRLNNDLNLRVSSRASVLLAYGMAAAIVSAFWRPAALLAAAAMAMALMAINAPLCRFFQVKRGTRFMIGAMLWHGFYYLYGGLAFGIALLRHVIGRLVRRLRVPRSSSSPGAGRTDAAYWDDIATSMLRRPRPLWRLHCDAVHVALLDRWMPTRELRDVLKTDLFDEAMGEGLYDALARRADRVVGVDVSGVVCAMAGRRHAGLEAAQADVRRLPFAGESFDAVFSNSTLDHLGSAQDILAALCELSRVLRPGGTLLLTLDNPGNPLVRLRGLLPLRWLNRLGIVPYQVGANCGRRRLEAYVRQAGLEVERRGAIMHCPRAAAVAVAALLSRPGRQDPARRFMRVLAAVEGLGAWPTRYLTGYFLALRAVKPRGGSGRRSDLVPMPERSG